MTTEGRIMIKKKKEKKRKKLLNLWSFGNKLNYFCAWIQIKLFFILNKLYLSIHWSQVKVTNKHIEKWRKLQNQNKVTKSRHKFHEGHEIDALDTSNKINKEKLKLKLKLKQTDNGMHRLWRMVKASITKVTNNIFMFVYNLTLIQ